MHQRGESTDQKSRCPHITLRFDVRSFPTRGAVAILACASNSRSTTTITIHGAGHGPVLAIALPSRARQVPCRCCGPAPGGRFLLDLLPLFGDSRARCAHITRALLSRAGRRGDGRARIGHGPSHQSWLRQAAIALPVRRASVRAKEG